MAPASIAVPATTSVKSMASLASSSWLGSSSLSPPARFETRAPLPPRFAPFFSSRIPVAPSPVCVGNPGSLSPSRPPKPLAAAPCCTCWARPEGPSLGGGSLGGGSPASGSLAFLAKAWVQRFFPPAFCFLRSWAAFARDRSTSTLWMSSCFLSPGVMPSGSFSELPSVLCSCLTSRRICTALSTSAIDPASESIRAPAR
mmetsp:Transcript_5742/g.13283  ORF Transcript_5742/g.13283 Transcript_5742/m.13283 type:complete len:200 (-) Transcript_5742:788-1387(-)